MEIRSAVAESAENGLAEELLLAVGNGFTLTVPDGITLLPVAAPLDSSPATPALEQRQRVEAALARPEGVAPLAEFAKGKRRAAVVVGDLSLPAPYDIALPAVVAELVKAEIRPTRIAFLSYPGNGYPILGRGAIHRYGEEVVGEHELRAWQAETADGVDPSFSASDLKILVAPQLPSLRPVVEAKLPFDLHLSMTLGRKPRIEIASAKMTAGISAAPAAREVSPEKADVLLASGGGSDWEATLEAALLSLHVPQASRLPGADAGGTPAVQSAALIFNGADGLGSAHFTRDLYDLLRQAEELLAKGSALDEPPASDVFDPAMTMASALSHYAHVVLFSSAFLEHSDGDFLRDTFAEWPHVSKRLHLCSHAVELWSTLKAAHGETFSVAAAPLGWRGAV